MSGVGDAGRLDREVCKYHAIMMTMCVEADVAISTVYVQVGVAMTTMCVQVDVAINIVCVQEDVATNTMYVQMGVASWLVLETQDGQTARDEERWLVVNFHQGMDDMSFQLRDLCQVRTVHSATHAVQ